MLANPNPHRPTYGLILNGSSFRFFKLVKLARSDSEETSPGSLVKGETSHYAVSRIFDLFNPNNDLYQVLRVLKHLAQLAISN